MSEIKKRIFVGVSLILSLIFLFFLPIILDIQFYLATLLLGFFALKEFNGWMEKRDLRVYRKLNYIVTFVLISIFYLSHLAHFSPAPMSHLTNFLVNGELLLMPLIVTTFVAFLLGFVIIYIVSNDQQDFFNKVSLQLFFFIYGVLFMAHAILFLNFENGKLYLGYCLIIPALMDSMAYFTGKYFGKHRAGIRLSPRKSWEGFFGGIFLTIIIMFALDWALFHWLALHTPFQDIPRKWELLAFTIAICIIAIFADLFESGIKRALKIKDSSNLIPGHGGLFDLIDSFLWTIPCGYYYFWFRKFVF